MMMCSVCKKNIAVVFTTKVIDGKEEPLWLCMECANKQGISPLQQMMNQSGMTDQDLDNITKQMMDSFDDMGDVDDIDKSSNQFLNFMNSAFSGLKGDKTNEFTDDSVTSSKSTDTATTDKNKKTKSKPKRKFLNSYGTNLTDKAKENKVDRIIGRHREIDRVIQILNRRAKNNPILIGEPGVGKTAIAEGLAVRIVEKQVPAKLYDAEIYLLDLTSVVAGTQFRGQFESRMKSIINEAKENGNIILVIDEVHNIMGAGEAESGAMNAANILKPALARGEIQVIGATTLDEYRKHIEKDAALERRFQPVLVEEPSVEDSIEIIKGIKDYYQDYHKVIIPDEIIEKAVFLSERYISDRFLPDKAIDVIDEAGSRANLKNQGLVELEALKSELHKVQQAQDDCASSNAFEQAAEYKIQECKLIKDIEELEKQFTQVEITLDDIAYVIEAWTKIPVQKITKLESEKLLNLESYLHKRVIGQDKAVQSLSRAIRRNRSGFRKKRKPASFIFVGPTGVGKTELAKTLTHELFDNEEAIIRFDMSEYMEKHTVSKLIGAPPGYVGFENAGQLTEKVRRKPYCVILLDEIEKAHTDVYNILLQILEDGRLSDSKGRVVNFENTIIIMTSNAGTDLKSSGMGFNNNNQTALESKVKGILKRIFKPEFLNRIDETIVFTELSKEELKQIIDLMLNEIITDAKSKNITISVTDSVKQFILDKGYDPKYGARPLRRCIQRHIEDELAELYLKGEITDDSKVVIDLEDDKVVVKAL